MWLGADVIVRCSPPVYDHLRGMKVNVVAINGAESAYGRSGRLEFANRRSELWWQMRDALDPATGRDLALPRDRALHADLCAPRWTLRGSRIQVETKEEIVKRLGRSPDRGDAVVYALPNYGPHPTGATFAQHQFNPFR